MATIDNKAGLFEYAGQKYFLAIDFYDEQGDMFTVDNESIESFEYINELNQLYITGSITLVDNKGYIDRLMNQMYPGCKVHFAQVNPKGDNEGTVKAQLNQIQADLVFVHQFFINNIQLIDRKQNVFRYKLQLVSSNIFKCLSVLNYTNYAKEPEKIFDIVKKLIGQAELTPDGETFGQVTSPVKMFYITNGNDNLLTSVKYLMNKQYYFNSNQKMYYEDKGYDPPRDTTPSMKFIWYNQFTDKIQLFDMNNRNTFSGFYNIVVSTGLDSLESMQNKENQNFSTVLKFPNIKFYQSMFRRHIYFFDIKKNDMLPLDDTKIDQPDLKQYFNKIHCPICSNTEKKMQDFVNKDTSFMKGVLPEKYYVRESYWNNRMDVYSTFVDAMTQNGAVIINTQGEILRKPANFIDLAVDKNIDYSKTDDCRDLKELERRYYQLHGTWVVAKVRNIIMPRLSRYRQNLTLFRNYKSKRPGGSGGCCGGSTSGGCSAGQ